MPSCRPDAHVSRTCRVKRDGQRRITMARVRLGRYECEDEYGYNIPMSEFQTVCKVGELSEGQGKTVRAGNKLVAVFFHLGQYFAIDDVCPHMGASLACGDLEQGVVSCSWHAWRFRLCDGTWV